MTQEKIRTLTHSSRNTRRTFFWVCALGESQQLRHRSDSATLIKPCQGSQTIATLRGGSRKASKRFARRPSPTKACVRVRPDQPRHYNIDIVVKASMLWNSSVISINGVHVPTHTSKDRMGIHALSLGLILIYLLMPTYSKMQKAPLLLLLDGGECPDSCKNLQKKKKRSHEG